MVVVIYPDSLQTNSAHKVKYAILLSIVYLQGKSTAANILPEQIDLQSYTMATSRLSLISSAADFRDVAAVSAFST